MARSEKQQPKARSSKSREYAKNLATKGPGRGGCNHGITFDQEAAIGLSPARVSLLFPRLCGLCPLGCGFEGTAYASWQHYKAGPW